MDELKPCPICGSPVSIKEIHIGRVYNDNRQDFSARLECCCGLTFEHEWITENGKLAFGTCDFATAWNRRANEEQSLA